MEVIQACCTGRLGEIDVVFDNSTVATMVVTASAGVL